MKLPILLLSLSVILGSLDSAQIRTEDARLVAPDGGPNERFGSAAAIDRDLALIGAYAHGGVQPSGGAAYLYGRDQGGPGRWGLVKKLVPVDLAPSDLFGLRVALEGDLAVCSSNDTVHVFARDAGGPGAWGEERRVSLSFTPFGPALALEGDTLVIGHAASGRVFVHERDLGGAGNWGRRATLVDPTPDGEAAFGSTVALSGSTLFVTRLPLTVFHYMTGTVHVHERDRGGANAWGAVQTLASPETGAADVFGRASVDGDLAVVGAMVGRAGLGAAYLYARTGAAANPWQLVRTFTSPDGRLFGRRAEIEGDVLTVELLFDDSLDPVRSSAQVFVRHLGGPDAWGALAKLTPAGTASSGSSVAALSHGTLLATDENEALSSGAAYVFDVARAANRVRNGAGTNPACYASATPPRLGATWRGVVDVSGHPLAVATLVMARGRPSDGLFVAAGEVLVDGASPRLFAHLAPVTGSSSAHVGMIPLDPALIGTALSTQAAILGGATRLCNALDLVLGP
jgi:hypothetical protein